MDSLVLEMQRRAMNRDVTVTDLVRTALVVATKLGVQEFREWSERELNGYADRDVPAYRRVQGQVKAWNPATSGFIPVRFKDEATEKALTTRTVLQPLGELETAYQDTGKDGILQMPFSTALLNELFGHSREYQIGMVPTVILARTQVYGILDAVRNAVLNWSLRLEADGILGEGMTFSQTEKEKAASHHTTYNINNFTGVLGNMSAEAVQIGDFGAIHSELKRRGVPQDQRNELEAILDELPGAVSADKKGMLIAKGGEWLKRNASTIGTLSEVIRGWFEAVK
jgi:hypothetical protein